MAEPEVQRQLDAIVSQLDALRQQFDALRTQLGESPRVMTRQEATELIRHQDASSHVSELKVARQEPGVEAPGRRDTEIVKMWFKGHTIVEIGRQHNLTKSRVHQIIQNNVDMTDPVMQEQRAEAKRTFHLNRILKLWDRGYGINQIARRIGRSSKVVRSLIIEFKGDDAVLDRKYGRSRSTPKLYSDEELTGALIKAADELGPDFTRKDYIQFSVANDLPSHMTITNRFDNWDAARLVAKLPPSGKLGRRPSFTDTDLLVSMYRVRMVLGHFPSPDEYAEHREDSEPSVHLARRRFKTWPGLKQRFDAWNS